MQSRPFAFPTTAGDFRAPRPVRSGTQGCGDEVDEEGDDKGSPACPDRHARGWISAALVLYTQGAQQP